MARRSTVAALLSLAAGYCAVAKRNGKQPAKAKAEPYNGPLFTSRALFGPAGRRRSLEECRDMLATPSRPNWVTHSRASSGSVRR